VACLALVAGGSSFAEAAGGGVSVASKSGKVQDFVHTSIGCGAGRHALAGGYSAGTEVISQRSAPTGSGGWQIRLFDVTGPPSPRPFKIFALCESSGTRQIRHVSREISFGVGKRRSVSVPCPTGWKVFSGGFSILPPYNGGVTGQIGIDRNQMLSGRKWIVAGTSDGVSSTIVAYADCERRSKPAVSQVSKQATLSASSSTAAVAACGPGKHLLGGGFRSQPTEAAGLFPAVTGSFPAGPARWKSVFAGPTAPGATLTSFAYCEPN